jgi:hypothetical protein
MKFEKDTLLTGRKHHWLLRCEMTKTVLKRQFITDAAGNPIGVILPLEEFALVEEILEQQPQTLSKADKLNQMEQAAHDPLFMADLRQTMSAFAGIDAEWWGRTW